MKKKKRRKRRQGAKEKEAMEGRIRVEPVEEDNDIDFREKTGEVELSKSRSIDCEETLNGVRSWERRE